VEITQALPRTELVRRAAELGPVVASHAEWNEEHRRIHEESVEALSDAGVFKMRVPTRYGGYESDMATTVDVLTQIGRADGSTSWVASIWSISTWIVGLFPDVAQEEVFATPDVRVCGILSPTGMAEPQPGGGWLLSGQWKFDSASQQSHWNLLAAMSPTPDGGMQPVMAVVPVSELQFIDDWHTTGMRGTGSVTAVAEGIHVPQDRAVPMGPLLHEQYMSKVNAESPIFRTPVIPTGSASVNGTVLGLAQAAMAAFRERLPGRKITYTDYADQSQAPITHRQLADATMRIDEAEFHAYKAADLLDTKGISGEPWTVEERARVRLDCAFVVKRAKEAVDVLKSASGASSIYSSVPIQRIDRDMQVINVHALMNPETNLELYGRVALGLEPNTLFL
jgi:3-hydroxy-9,10-secoandrosta-1,3,5(10)-triene-9,17-dione monooxygenase